MSARPSLSADTKDALAREIPPEPHCRVALRDGLLLYGAQPLADGTVLFRTQRASVARLLKSLQERGEERAIVKRPGTRLYKTPAYEIALAAAPVPPLPRARCDRRMELRGAFLAAGSLAAPSRGYHLEFTLATAALADRLETLLKATGPAPKRTERRGRPLLYYKGVDDVVAVLSALGAYGAVLHLEDVRAVKDTKNHLRRLVNTEAANVDRAMSAAAAQREVLAYVRDAYGFRQLSPAVREVAELRLAHPDETLAELGRRCSPPVGKSTVNGRLAVLMRLARRLRQLSGEGSSTSGG